MKFDLEKVIVTAKGTPALLAPATPTGAPKELTFGAAFVEALGGQLPNDNPDKAEKIRRFKLSLRIVDQKEIELSADDVRRLDDVCSKGWSTEVYGQIWKALGVESEG